MGADAHAFALCIMCGHNCDSVASWSIFGVELDEDGAGTIGR